MARRPAAPLARTPGRGRCTRAGAPRPRASGPGGARSPPARPARGPGLARCSAGDAGGRRARAAGRRCRPRCARAGRWSPGTPSRCASRAGAVGRADGPGGSPIRTDPDVGAMRRPSSARSVDLPLPEGRRRPPCRRRRAGGTRRRGPAARPRRSGARGTRRLAPHDPPGRGRVGHQLIAVGEPATTTWPDVAPTTWTSTAAAPGIGRRRRHARALAVDDEGGRREPERLGDDGPSTRPSTRMSPPSGTSPGGSRPATRSSSRDVERVGDEPPPLVALDRDGAARVVGDGDRVPRPGHGEQGHARCGRRQADRGVHLPDHECVPVAPDDHPGAKTPGLAPSPRRRAKSRTAAAVAEPNGVPGSRVPVYRPCSARKRCSWSTSAPDGPGNDRTEPSGPTSWCNPSGRQKGRSADT